MGILKPAYNAIDMVEVELLDDGSEPRQFADDLLMVNIHTHTHNRIDINSCDLCIYVRQVRQQIINQQNGSSYMLVKFHMDHKV